MAVFYKEHRDLNILFLNEGGCVLGLEYVLSLVALSFIAISLGLYPCKVSAWDLDITMSSIPPRVRLQVGEPKLSIHL